MKGHTKIELTDVNTGEVEVIEHDNMITSAIEKELLSSNGIMPTCLNAKVYTNLFDYDYLRNLFGGIFLFNQPLSDNKDDYFIPFDNEMIGYGYFNTTNSGNNVQLGSYSNSESGFQDDGSFKWVYNFDTSQANGQISSVALTSYVSGVLSAGIKNENYDPTKFPSNFTSVTTETYSPVYAYAQQYGLCARIRYNGIPVYMDDNYIYLVNYSNFVYTTNDYIGKNGKKLNVLKYANPMGKINPFDKYNLQQNKVEEFVINLPENFTFGNLQYALFDIQSDGNFYFIVNQAEYVTGTIQLIKIDIINKSSVLYSTTIPSGKYLRLYHIYDCPDLLTHQLYAMTICNNKLVCHVNQYASSSATRNLYIIDLDTQEQTIMEDFPFSGNISPDLNISKRYGTKYLIVRGSSSNNLFFALDTETKSIVRLCTHPNSYYNYPTMDILNFREKHIYSNYTGKASSGTLNLYSVSPAQFLTTKNNLEKPVTKTSSQSMKVTYTLTPA